MMIRTQLQLTEEQVRALRQRAEREGVSVSECVRRILDRSLRAEDPGRSVLYGRAWDVVGRFRDREGAREVARNHDEYLDESFR